MFIVEFTYNSSKGSRTVSLNFTDYSMCTTYSLLDFDFFFFVREVDWIYWQMQLLLLKT